MSIFFKKARQISASVLAVSVLATSINLLAFAPAQAVDCPQLAPLTRFKVINYPAVYVVSKDYKRMYFPNAEVYDTWYSNYLGIVTIDPICVDNYPSGGGINYRPGSRLVKTALSPSVFAIGPNNTKHRFTNESTAVVLYDNNWPVKVRILTDAFDSNLKVGSDVQDIILVDGMSVNIEDDPQVYFVTGGKLKKVVGTIPTFLKNDVRTIRQTMLEDTPISAETTTAAEILADPTQGGVTFGNTSPVTTPTQPTTPVQPTQPVTPTQPTTPVQTSNSNDLISSFKVVGTSSGSSSFQTEISYGSGVSYPWYPGELTLDQNQNSMVLTMTPKTSGNITYAYGWQTGTTKPDFTRFTARDVAGATSFTANTQYTLSFGDFYRGKWITVYGFARNNDGVSTVSDMNVEVDDVVVARVYIPAKTTITPPVVDSSYLIDSLSVYSQSNEFLGSANSGYLRLKSYAAKQLLDVPASVSQLSLRVNRSSYATQNYTYGYVWVDSSTGSTNFDENLAKKLVPSSFGTFANGGTLNATDYYRGKYVTLLAYMRNNDGVSRVPNMPVEVDDIIAIHFKFAPKATVNSYLGTAPSIVTPTTNQVFVNKEYKIDAKFTTVPTSKSYELVVDCYDCETGDWTNTSQINLTHNDSGYVNTTIGPFADGKSYRLRTRPGFTDSVTGEYVSGTWSDYRYFSFKATAPTPAVQGTKEISLTELNALQPKTISFEDVGGEIITKYVSLYGVTIWSNNGKAIYVNDYNRGGAKASSGAYSISNNGTHPKTSYNDPLFLGFNTPVKAVGFYLVGNANFYGEQRDVTITVTGPSGKVLGTYKKRVYESSTTYFGFQSDELIYKVDIDNGASYASEGIDDLMLVR